MALYRASLLTLFVGRLLKPVCRYYRGHVMQQKCYRLRDLNETKMDLICTLASFIMPTMTGVAG